MEGFAGATAIETRLGVIVTGSEELIAPIVALTKHCPLVFVVSMPPWATIAILLSEVAQLATEVTSLVLPSL
jgi:hypothetical protein